MNVCHMEICACLRANTIHHSYKAKIHTFVFLHFFSSSVLFECDTPNTILTRFIHLHAAKMNLIIIFNADLRAHFEIALLCECV